MGALPQLYAASMPDVMADDYWGPDALPRAARPPDPRRPHEARAEHRRRQRLWERSEELTGVTYSWP